jgi:hypothetical protein
MVNEIDLHLIHNNIPVTAHPTNNDTIEMSE